MAKKYRIKEGYEYVVEEVQPYEEQLFKMRSYKVQVRVLFFWVTVKQYTNTLERKLACSYARELFDILLKNN